MLKRRSRVIAVACYWIAVSQQYLLVKMEISGQD